MRHLQGVSRLACNMPTRLCAVRATVRGKRIQRECRTTLAARIQCAHIWNVVDMRKTVYTFRRNTYSVQSFSSFRGGTRACIYPILFHNQHSRIPCLLQLQQKGIFGFFVQSRDVKKEIQFVKNELIDRFVKWFHGQCEKKEHFGYSFCWTKIELRFSCSRCRLSK